MKERPTGAGDAAQRLSEAGHAGHPAARMLQRHLDGLAAAPGTAVAAGVVVMAGTDERAHGSVREEAELLRRYGLTAPPAVAAG